MGLAVAASFRADVDQNCRMSGDDQVRLWAWSDAWVLAAIMMTDKEGGSELTEVVAAALTANWTPPARVVLGSVAESHQPL
jgi:hypothetical protein